MSFNLYKKVEAGFPRASDQIKRPVSTRQTPGVPINFSKVYSTNQQPKKIAEEASCNLEEESLELPQSKP